MTLLVAIRKLARVRWRVFINGFLNASPRRVLRLIAVILLALFLAAAGFVMSTAILSFLQSEEAAELFTPRLLTRFPILLLSGIFATVLLLSFQILLQALYLAGDMDLLLSLPVPARAVFVVKLAEAILPSLALSGLISLPVLWALGASSGWNAVYYPLAPLLLTLEVLVAASLSALLVMAVVRVFPARRVFEVISVLGALLAMLCSQWYNLARAFGAESGELAPGLLRTAGALDFLTSPWLPLAWPGTGLAALAQGRWLAGFGYLAATVAAAAVVFIASLATAERLYSSGWAKVHESPARKTGSDRSRATLATRRIPLLSPAVSGIVLKDWRTLRRDLRLVSQLIQPVILTVIYLVLLLVRGRSSDSLVNLTQRYAVYSGIGVSLFASWGIITRVATGAFSQEGKNYWILKSAPISAGQLVLAKWIAAYLPGLTLGSLLLISLGVLQRATVGGVLFGWVVVALILAGATGMNLAIGAANARLDWTDPRQMIPSGAGCVAFLLGAVFLLFSMALSVGPALAAQVLDGPVRLGRLVGLILGGAFSLAAAFLPPRWAVRRVRRIGEESD